jgi:hypothetical protein
MFGVSFEANVWMIDHFLFGLEGSRAFARQGDTVKARAAYQSLFMLCKDADPDIPILKQAKTEYARLQ